MSTGKSRPQAVAPLFQRASRTTYVCPVCDEVLGAPKKTWEHAKQEHKDVLGVWGISEEEAKKKAFLKEAVEKQSKNFDESRGSRRVSRTAGNEDQAAVESASPERPSTAPGLATHKPSASQDPGTKASVFERLPTVQDKSSYNQLERARGPATNVVPDAPEDDDLRTKPRPVKSQSGEPPTGQDPDFQRGQAAAMETETRPTAARQKLFDPGTGRDDQPRKGNFHGQVSGGDRQSTSRDLKKRHASSDGGERQTRPIPQEFSTSRRNLQSSGHIAVHETPQNTTGNEEDSQEQGAPPHMISDDPEPGTELLLQPETRPISHEQLVVEVKGIYAGLVMVEAKCIEVDERQTIRAQGDPSTREPLKNDQWQSLIALHKQLLHEHHDFFLASQHPSASSNLSKLAAKYSMPARMWRHGIHAFLEVLRHRLPDSLEHMLAFIYIAYSMMALLYETVSTFEDTWIECLGDLGRYRMAIEDDEPKDREVWSGVARFWYTKAADKNPTVGRLYHHLAILARPYTLEQLSFYTRSLTCVTPFESARGSIMTLFNPVLNGREAGHHRSSSMESLTIKAHGLLFLFPQRPLQEIDDVLAQLKDKNECLIEEFIEKNGPRFKRNGIFLAVSNIAAMLEFGALTSKGTHRSMIRRALDVKATSASQQAIGTPSYDSKVENAAPPPPILTDKEIEASKIVVSYASDLTFSMFETILAERNWGRSLILPMVHVMLVFLHCMSSIPEAMKPFEHAIPWAAICFYLNHIEAEDYWTKIFEDKSFPSTEGTTGRPPPEDYIMRGQLYTQGFFPETWFSDAKVDDEERMLEQSSHDTFRSIRVLWLAVRISDLEKWILLDKETKKFRVVSDNRNESSKSIIQENKVSPKIEQVDDDEVMKDVPTTAKQDQDAMSDVTSEETLKEKASYPSQAVDTDDTPNPSTTTTRTNTDRTNITEVTERTEETLQDDPGTLKPPSTPTAADLERPEDTPMVDLSPGKEHTSLASHTPMEGEEASWLQNPAVDPRATLPQKEVADFVSDPNAVRILQVEENLEDNRL